MPLEKLIDVIVVTNTATSITNKGQNIVMY